MAIWQYVFKISHDLTKQFSVAIPLREPCRGEQEGVYNVHCKIVSNSERLEASYQGAMNKEIVA